MAKRTTQTTRMNGKRVRIVTTTGPTGTKVTVEAAPVLEWQLQAEAVRQLKAMPEYASSASMVAANDNSGRPSFAIAADMNGDYRSKRAAVIAKATGIAAGDPDLRLYGQNGSLLLIEFKNAEGRLSADQKERHALLRALGYRIEVVKAATEDDAARQAVDQVRSWLALTNL
ncbi:VRR-NUC domain-containing protein [Rhizobium binae]|uniref:VRR-NUC domain-containing protein n=1 Tax=Rhizobium binae TaxID=1138190 RepID=UPI001C83D6AD|nr:VRR-NUC domain-containing protein [Rhizobium binae]MBX4941159.1 VRR-NUC domain-containing protein [Rhizobium binae]